MKTNSSYWRNYANLYKNTGKNLDINTLQKMPTDETLENNNSSNEQNKEKIMLKTKVKAKKKVNIVIFYYLTDKTPPPPPPTCHHLIPEDPTSPDFLKFSSCWI